MRRLIVALAAIALVLAPATARAADGLKLTSTTRLSPRLTELTFTTPAIAGPTKVFVLTPAGYSPSAAMRYPVLWLLHGAVGSAPDWVQKGMAEEITAKYPFIVVMPDSGSFGNYTDWYNGGRGGAPMYETYHLSQLVPWVDAHYPTIANRNERAVAGLSMGGAGALVYAAHRPDLFGAAAAFSGTVDNNEAFGSSLVTVSSLTGPALPDAIFGPRATQEVRWRNGNAYDLAENLGSMFLQLDTGNGLPGGPYGFGDPVELEIGAEMTHVHDKLVQLGTPHIWNNYGAGGHDWKYWQRDLSELLPRLQKHFADATDAPTPRHFTYKTTKSLYSMFGFDVQISRPKLEFSVLDVSTGGFTLRGTGSAVVTLPSAARPGQIASVRVDDAGRGFAGEVRPDAHGRLRIPVSLGPGNPKQQYTYGGRLWAATHGTGTGWPVRTAQVMIRYVTPG